MFNAGNTSGHSLAEQQAAMAQTLREQAAGVPALAGGAGSGGAAAFAPLVATDGDVRNPQKSEAEFLPLSSVGG